MKAQFTEYDAVFNIELIAENMQEAAQITRFGINSLKELFYKAAYVDKDGSFSLSMSVKKSKRPTASIGK